MLDVISHLHHVKFQLFHFLHQSISDLHQLPLLSRLFGYLRRQSLQLILQIDVLTRPRAFDVTQLYVRLFQSILQHFPLVQQKFDVFIVVVGGSEESTRLLNDLKTRRQVSNLLVLGRDLCDHLVLFNLHLSPEVLEIVLKMRVLMDEFLCALVQFSQL